MSYTIQNTPLQLNFESELLVNRGLWINDVARSYQGVWLAQQPWAQPVTGSYTQGTVTSTNCVGILTDALPNFYNNTPTVNATNIESLSVVVWRNLLRIGRPNDSRPNNGRINCPALGNSRPDSFFSNYPGYGSFQVSSTTDQFGNKISAGKPGLIESVYPPYNYPAQPNYSYVWLNWSSLSPSPGAPNDIFYSAYSTWQEQYQYHQEYSWITGWPGRNPWQEKGSGDAQIAVDPVADGDSYAAAYFPRPDIRTRDRNKIEYDEYFSRGFIATVARQAYYEFWSSHENRRPNQYIEFTRSFSQNYSYQEQSNRKINSLLNTKIFLKSSYSNINDLSTMDLAGVNLAFRAWGSDMIALGKSLYLGDIEQFGLPSKFLLNLQACNAITPALAAALLLADLSTVEITSSILNPTYTPSKEEERKAYFALQLIQGQDLEDIKIILNCTTSGLNSLADLINPIKMFPNSYPSLTIPQYTIAGNSAKTYRFIYNGANVNTDIENWGDYLSGILPADLAMACGAFMMTMCQVKNINRMEMLSLSQVIYNLEVVNKDLPLINSADGVPGSIALANQELARTALGSGRGGTYRFADFAGAMSGWPYRDYYKPVQQIIPQLQTEALFNVYRKLYQKSLFNNWALIGRGKGWADQSINNTGIAAGYAYHLFEAASFNKPHNQYYVWSDGPTTVTINNAGNPVNAVNLFTGSLRPARTNPGDSYPQTINQSNYPTGTLISFVENPTQLQTYVVNSSTANTVTLQSIVNYNYYTRTQGGGSLSGNTVTYTNVPSSALGDVGPNWRLDRAYVTSRSWVANPLPNPGNLGTLTITLDTGGYPVTQTTTYSSPYPYRGWPGLSQPVNPAIGNRVYIIEWEYNGYPGNGLTNGTVQNLIDAANLEILRISAENPIGVSDLNYYWSQIGKQMFLEQRAIPFSVPQCDAVYLSSSRQDLFSFSKAVETYAQNTEYCESAPILEAISDNGIGGQSITGSQREARNAIRLQGINGILDNDVSDAGDTTGASVVPVINNGQIASIEVTSGGAGYDVANPPEVLLYPNGGAWGCTGSGGILGTPVIDPETGAIVSIPVLNGGSGYTYDCTNIVIAPPPNPNRNLNSQQPYPGTPAVPGSLSGLTDLQVETIVPNNLTTGADASYSVEQAKEVVTTCNCECWNL